MMNNKLRSLCQMFKSYPKVVRLSYLGEWKVCGVETSNPSSFLWKSHVTKTQVCQISSKTLDNEEGKSSNEQSDKEGSAEILSTMAEDTDRKKKDLFIYSLMYAFHIHVSSLINGKFSITCSTNNSWMPYRKRDNHVTSDLWKSCVSNNGLNNYVSDDFQECATSNDLWNSRTFVRKNFCNKNIGSIIRADMFFSSSESFSRCFQPCRHYSIICANYNDWNNVSHRHSNISMVTARGIKKKQYQFPEIKEEDISEVFQRGSGPGGQSVAKTNNCVVLKHHPTGITVKCHESRSLDQNRRIAREKLKEQLDVHLNGENSFRELVKKEGIEHRSKKKARARKRQKMREALKENQEEESESDMEITPEIESEKEQEGKSETNIETNIETKSKTNIEAKSEKEQNLETK